MDKTHYNCATIDLLYWIIYYYFILCDNINNPYWDLPLINTRTDLTPNQ